MSEITLFKYRFLTNSHRHPDISWEDVEARLIAHPEKFAILEKMEETGGEPDIV
jgi:Protein of unknown function (DUF4256)